MCNSKTHAYVELFKGHMDIFSNGILSRFNYEEREIGIEMGLVLSMLVDFSSSCGDRDILSEQLLYLLVHISSCFMSYNN